MVHLYDLISVMNELILVCIHFFSLQEQEKQRLQALLKKHDIEF